MSDKTRIQGNVGLHVGRFSEGIEQLPGTPRKRRVGRFNSGIERRPDAPGKLRRGSFADGYAACSVLVPSVETTAAPGHGAPPAGSSSPWPHNRHEAEVEDILRALRGYGVLTRARLLEVCGAARWSDLGFRRALAHAVSSGRIRQLGDDLYEIAEPPTR